MADKKKVRLLVINDHDDEGLRYSALVQEYSELCSYQYDIQCRSVDSRAAAIEIVQGWQPSVVLIDVHLSDMNGLDLVRLYSQDALPVIVCSEFRSAEIEQSAKALGAVAYVPKAHTPEDLESLLAVVAAHSLDNGSEH